jgi:glycine hydroxymethyltransferase
MLVDLRPWRQGQACRKALDRPASPATRTRSLRHEKPLLTSGIRLGTPAGTTRGFGEAEFTQIGKWIAQVVDGLARMAPMAMRRSRPAWPPKWKPCAPASIYPKLASRLTLRCFLRQ